MKAKLKYWRGLWWCKIPGITGAGETVKEAWAEMCGIYEWAYKKAYGSDETNQKEAKTQNL